MTSARDLVHALSFDVEDWFHMVDIPATESREAWGSFPSVAERRTEEILGLLRRHRTCATFFVLGWVGERYPSLVRRIADEGHEIGAHSFWHKKVYEQRPDEFLADLRRTVQVLEQHRGVKVFGYRAPSFSIMPGCEWALDSVLEAGLEYDSSLFPGSRAHGGYPCPHGPHWAAGQKGRIPELPASVAAWGPARLCYSGGGYFRALPYPLIEMGFRRMASRGIPTVVYLHPRDFAVLCPEVEMPVVRRIKCYVGRTSTARKLRTLLRRFRFDTCREVLRRSLGIGAPGC
jgi:polysaccharide deacetylase family protein (PEP-CTERM system associated)